MEDIPSEFRPYASFIIAAENVKKYNPIAAQVLTQVFVDICQDIIQTTVNKKAHDFLTNLTNNLPEFPRDGPDETKLLADDLYDSICSSLRSGKLNTHISQQFWLCGILYSVLAGDEAEKRERICKITAARLKAIMKKAEIKKAPPKNQIDNNIQPKGKLPNQATNLHNNNNNNNIPNFSASTKPNTNPSKNTNQAPVQQLSATNKPQKKINPSQSSNNGPTYESVITHYSEKKAYEYLKSIGVSVPSSVPTLNEKCRPLIAQNFDLSLSCLAQNDTQQAKLFLQKAQKSWKTGKT